MTTTCPACDGLGYYLIPLAYHCRLSTGGRLVKAENDVYECGECKGEGVVEAKDHDVRAQNNSRSPMDA